MGDVKPVYIKTDIASQLRDSQQKCRGFIARHVDNKGSETSFAEAIQWSLMSQKEIECSSIGELQNQATSYNYGDLVKVQAPMVRCSRPPFRKLCRLWGTDISYTHMMIADSFVKSEEARKSDFALFENENKLICQFAAKDGPTLSQAAQIVAPYCDGIDINCGCPQKWAIKEGIGSALLESPELVSDMVKCVRNSDNGNLPCVVKMRVYDDLSKSVEFARRAEAAGIAWLTVHGRTPKCTPGSRVRHESIKIIAESVNIPVVANGGVDSPTTALDLALRSGVGGVMSAQGLLDNPACFYHDNFRPVYGIPFEGFRYEARKTTVGNITKTGSSEIDSMMIPDNFPTVPPRECISDFCRLAVSCNLPLKATQHHLLMMSHKHLTPAERLYIGEQGSIISTLVALKKCGVIVPWGLYN
eukprot:Tbor_TRINITY_DN4714_c1_g1::TRINITY_DN4714_c1_g1_i1::g.16941::m.16941/K05545/DUS4; tRNA-dihydrouridine synthase 4